ncbi:hypothetical protein [Endozoicomonas lisbonensis]|uniref:Uncharacterized protein n=1 Tax=Endozoicomonas lisbonensis TaxID=3120522 RepID=A0ABV2SCN5_9GAMM
MKHISFSTALLILFFLWTKPLCAQDIKTPFGSLPDTFQYQKSGENSPQHTVTMNQVVINGNEKILVSLDGAQPQSIPQDSINEVTRHRITDRTKRNFLIALIIISLEMPNYSQLAESGTYQSGGARDGSGRQASVRDAFTFIFPALDADRRYPLIGNVPNHSDGPVNHWLVNITNPFPVQFTVIMPYPEPAPESPAPDAGIQAGRNDTGDSESSDGAGYSCFGGICRRVGAFFAY